MTPHHTKLYGFAARLPRPAMPVRVPSRPDQGGSWRRDRGGSSDPCQEHALDLTPESSADDLALPVSAIVPFAEVGRPLGCCSEMAMRLLATATEDATGLPFTVVNPMAWMKAQEGEGTDRALVVDRASAHRTSDMVSIRLPVVVTDGESMQFGVAVELNFSAEFVALYEHEIAWNRTIPRRPLELRVSPELVDASEPFYRFTFDLDGRDHQVTLRSGAHKANTGTGTSSRAGGLTDAGPGAGRLQIFEGGPALQPLCEFEHLRVWQRDARGKDHLAALGTQGDEVVWTRHLLER